MVRWLRSPDLASVVLRLTLAAIFLTHAGMKILYFDGGTAWYSEFPAMSPALQATVAWGEMLCGLALAVGLLTRVAALGAIAIMIGAISLVTWQLDFTILPNAMAHGSTVGYEYNYTIIAMCVALVALGAGVLSLDHLLFGKRHVAGAAAPAAAGVPYGARV